MNRKIGGIITAMLVLGLGLMAALQPKPVLASVSLDISASIGGTVTSPGLGIFYYDAGTTVNLVAVANSGYEFSEWIGDDTSTIANVGAATTTITMSGSYQITANFVPSGGGGGGGSTTTYSITATANANGSISPYGTVTVSSGGSQTFYITPDTGYRVADVQVDGSSVGAVTNYTFSSVTADHTITASFVLNTFTITASAGANGSISPAGATTVNYGGNQGYTITPNTGYHITGVLVDGASVGVVNSYTFSNVSSAHTISASFAINTYTITASTGANGAISPAGATTVNYGGSQAYTITPNTGYHVNTIQVDGASISAVTAYTFSGVTADHTIAVTFAINTYTMTAMAGDHGTISPSGTAVVNYGGSQTYKITPNTGYHITDVTVDGASVGALNSYSFTNITSNHVISVSFAINTYIITPTAGKHGSMTPFVAVTINYGDSQTFTIVPDTAYRVADVKVDGTSVGAVSSYDFVNVTKDHTIEATFAIGWPFYVAFGLGALLVFLLGFLVGKKTGGGGSY